MSERGFLRKMLLMVAGLLIWAVHFTIAYGFNALACARGFSSTEIFGVGIVPLVVGLATLVCWTGVVTVLAHAGLPLTRTDNVGTALFLRHATGVIAVLSLIAIALSAIPVLVLRSC